LTEIEAKGYSRTEDSKWNIHTPFGGAVCGSSARRYSSALLLAIASLLTACGGASGNTSTAAGSTTSGTATLAWDAVTDANLNGYKVYHGTASGTYLQAFGQGISVGNNVIAYTVSGLSSGTTYYFAATAYDTMGNESGYSNEVSKDVP